MCGAGSVLSTSAGKRDGIIILLLNMFLIGFLIDLLNLELKSCMLTLSPALKLASSAQFLYGSYALLSTGQSVAQVSAVEPLSW